MRTSSILEIKVHWQTLITMHDPIHQHHYPTHLQFLWAHTFQNLFAHQIYQKKYSFEIPYPPQNSKGRKKESKKLIHKHDIDNIDNIIIIHKQDKLMPPSSWKDYAANGNGQHHTNYAYEHYEADPRGGGMPPLPPGAPRGHHPQMPMHHNGSLQRPRPSGGYSRGPQGYSLPRPTNGYGGPPPPPPGYGSYDRRGYHSRPPGHMQPPDYAPDHYFMPSQRKYSGEVVRVFVDYNK